MRIRTTRERTADVPDSTRMVQLMPTNDHTVPQKYLQRFAELRSGKGYYTTSAAPVDDLENTFTPSLNKVGAVKGFYWATTPDGADHHDMELLLQRVEDDAIPAFRTMLDDKEVALPLRWPLPPDQRVAMAWWMAAQIRLIPNESGVGV